LYLARALILRFDREKQPSDLEYGIKYLRLLLRLPLSAQITGVQFAAVVTELVEALSHEIELNLKKQRENIEEMLALYCKLPSWGPLNKYVAHILSIMSRNVFRHSFRTGILDYVEQLMVHLREARKFCQPKDHPELSIDLADLLMVLLLHGNFQRNYMEEMKELANEAASSLPPNHPRRLEPFYTILVSDMFQLAFLDQSVDCVTKVINTTRVIINELTASRTHSPSTFHLLLSIVLYTRYQSSGDDDSLKEARESMKDAFDLYKPVELPSHYRTSDGWLNKLFSLCPMLETQLVSLIDPGNLRTSLGSCTLPFKNYDTTDLKEESKFSSKSSQGVVPLSPSISAGALTITVPILQAFHDDQGVPDKLIDLCQSTIDEYPTHPLRFSLLRSLGGGLFDRSTRTGRSEDNVRAVCALKAAFEEECMPTSDRFVTACIWARLARIIGHPSTSLAYQSALSVMQDLFSQGPTVQAQHRIVENLGRDINIPLDGASYQIEQGQMEHAVESVEHGRALLWSEMRGLRTSVDQLRIVDSALADRFQVVSRALEGIATTVSQHGAAQLHHAATGDRGEPDAFSRTLKQHHKFKQEHQEIISRVRDLPDFRHFLRPAPFETLRHAASAGPVIIVNHCGWRCDIVIVLHSAPIFVIPTPSHFYERANTLATKLLDTRKSHLLESKHYNSILRWVLRELHELVGQPVIKKLRELGIPEQSRVWWCPTSVFCSLPLHAMGPIRSNKSRKRYFSDLYVCSYTPSLSALIASRERISQKSSRSPSLLVVNQFSSEFRGAEEVERIKSFKVPVTALDLEKATRATVIKGLQEHSLTHFTCHGQLEPGKPFDASLRLHDGDRLTLLDIMRSRREGSISEFAFLAACHTAELTVPETPDEVLHLVAAVQYYGFRSVVGTMWAMADRDGADLSTFFYRRMFSPAEGERSTPLCEKSARALRDAVFELRNKEGITLERWVNFVHYGA
jgi:CHAT domain-containing protein